MFAILLLVSALSLLFFTVYFSLKRRFQFWEKKNVPHSKPVSVLGNYPEFVLLKKNLGQLTQKLCKIFPNVPYIGAFYGTEPALIVQDPAFIKQIMTKDFYFFSGREITKYNDRELLAKNLFFTDGDEWKSLRQNMSPLFSSAKMKNMFHLIKKCAHIFETVLDREIKLSNVIEVRMLMARFTMDCIGSCAFGIDTQTMEKAEGNSFMNIGNVIFDTQPFRAFKSLTRSIWPAIFYGLGFEVFPKEVGTFFHQLMTGVFEGRQHKPSSRNDFVDLVLKFNNNKSITGGSLKNMKSDSGKKLNLEVNDDFLVAQCFTFFAAGYETSATTSSFTMYELAKNPEAQDRVLREVDEYLRRHDNAIKYECVTEMPYLEACIDEALRLYPVLGVITREVAEDYSFSTGLKVEKGLRVHLPVYHLHHNPDYFPEPEEFRPERFLGEEKRNIKPYTYLPFGEGPRVCIGMRFAKMQILAGLITLLKKYRLELAPGMTRNVELEPKSIIITQASGGINLKLVEREGWEQRVFQTQQVS